MKRLALSMVLAGLSGAGFAAEPAFCKSMCSSEKTQCLAGIKVSEAKEGADLADMPDKNPYARTAQLQMRSDDGGGLQKAGNAHRRMARTGACDDGYQRCVRSCSVEGDKDAVGTVVSRHARKAG